LVLKHLENLLGGNAPQEVRPVVRYAEAKEDAGEGGWARLSPGKPLPQADGRMWAEWEVEAPRSHLDLAVCYPYGMPEVRQLVEAGQGYWRADVIGLSQAGRPLVRLSNNAGAAEETSRRPGAYFLARQHSGETPGSWVLDGLLRCLAEERVEDLTVWAVPLSNIDGVEQGDYGKDNFPWDLNRAWGRPPMRHETLVLAQDARRWRARCRPRLAIDFHAPGLCETTGLYAYGSKPELLNDALAAQETRWLGVVREALGPYAARDFARVGRYPSRWEQGPHASDFFRSLEGVYAFTLECSYLRAGELLLTRAHYREAGRRMGRALARELRRE
jgi:hypothetical protein